jgi:ABC-2 type transport system ATP-binding protein
VFLTTQYLEEADSLSDRVGIIDRGRIVAEDTPANLKAAIGSPTVEVVPADADSSERLAELLSRFGEPARSGRESISVQLPQGEAQLADVIRVLDQAGLRVASLHLHQPSLDDVFLAKTGRKLEGSADAPEPDEQPPARGRGRRGR